MKCLRLDHLVELTGFIKKGVVVRLFIVEKEYAELAMRALVAVAMMCVNIDDDESSGGVRCL